MSRAYKNTTKSIARAHWMGTYERVLVDLRPEFAGKVDWDTATHLFNQHEAPEDAARKVAGRVDKLREDAKVALARNESILRAQAPWTEQQERLLAAAQTLISEANEYEEARDGERVTTVDPETFAALKAVVQEISRDAANLLDSQRTERAEACGDLLRSLDEPNTGNIRCKLPKGHEAHGKAHSDGQRRWN